MANRGTCYGAADTAGNTLNIAGMVFGIVEFAVSIALAATTVRLGMWALDRATHDLDEPAELARGNVAVAILHGALLLAIAVIVRRAIEPAVFAAKALVAQFGGLEGGLLALAWVGGYAVVAAFLALVGLLVAVRVAQRALGDVDTMAALRGGNVAIAIMLAAVVAVIAIFLADGVAALIDALPPPGGLVRIQTAGP